jgi:hypothetical protein
MAHWSAAGCCRLAALTGRAGARRARRFRCPYSALRRQARDAQRGSLSRRTAHAGIGRGARTDHALRAPHRGFPFGGAVAIRGGRRKLARVLQDHLSLREAEAEGSLDGSRAEA